MNERIVECRICGYAFVLIDATHDGSPEAIAIVQDALAKQMREMLDHPCICRTCGTVIAETEVQAVGSECAHPSEQRTSLASMGSTSDHFYCKACGETIGGD